MEHDQRPAAVLGSLLYPLPPVQWQPPYLEFVMYGFPGSDAQVLHQAREVLRELETNTQLAKQDVIDKLKELLLPEETK